MASQIVLRCALWMTARNTRRSFISSYLYRVQDLPVQRLFLLKHTSSFHTSISHHAKKGKKHKAKVVVDMSADEDILDLNDVKENMQKAIDALKKDYTNTLTIRTSQGALDHILVSTPDGKFPLNQLGQMSFKSSSSITVNLANFPQATEAAAKAIREAGMNLNPKIEGSIIHVPIPKVTKEHRENLVKSAKGLCDKAKVNIRSVRSKYITSVRKHKEGTSKDTIFQLEQQIHQVADSYNDSAEKLLSSKTKELLGK
nr:ribosome-recycling factor, mitochondrial-like [Lytechinus pictus]